MSPTTTEAKLEEELSSHKEKIDNVRYKIEAVQIELRGLKSQMIEHKLAYEQKEEELRRFRLMYPDICKPPTR